MESCISYPVALETFRQCFFFLPSPLCHELHPGSSTCKVDILLLNSSITPNFSTWVTSVCTKSTAGTRSPWKHSCIPSFLNKWGIYCVLSLEKYVQENHLIGLKASSAVLSRKAQLHWALSFPRITFKPVSSIEFPLAASTQTSFSIPCELTKTHPVLSCLEGPPRTWTAMLTLSPGNSSRSLTPFGDSVTCRC